MFSEMWYALFVTLFVCSIFIIIYHWWDPHKDTKGLNGIFSLVYMFFAQNGSMLDGASGHPKKKIKYVSN